MIMPTSVQQIREFSRLQFFRNHRRFIKFHAASPPQLTSKESIVDEKPSEPVKLVTPAPLAPVTLAPVKLPKLKLLKMPNLTPMPSAAVVPTNIVTPVLLPQRSQSSGAPNTLHTHTSAKGFHSHEGNICKHRLLQVIVFT